MLSIPERSVQVNDEQKRTNERRAKGCMGCAVRARRVSVRKAAVNDIMEPQIYTFPISVSLRLSVFRVRPSLNSISGKDITFIAFARASLAGVFRRLLERTLCPARCYPSPTCLELTPVSKLQRPSSLFTVKSPTAPTPRLGGM